jgi:uncharacterized membrane protein
MQTPAVLFDFVSNWDIAIFFSVPVALLVVAFVQAYLEWKAAQRRGR